MWKLCSLGRTVHLQMQPNATVGEAEAAYGEPRAAHWGKQVLGGGTLVLRYPRSQSTVNQTGL